MMASQDFRRVIVLGLLTVAVLCTAMAATVHQWMRHQEDARLWQTQQRFMQVIANAYTLSQQINLACHVRHQDSAEQDLPVAYAGPLAAWNTLSSELLQNKISEPARAALQSLQTTLHELDQTCRTPALSRHQEHALTYAASRLSQRLADSGNAALLAMVTLSPSRSSDETTLDESFADKVATGVVFVASGLALLMSLGTMRLLRRTRLENRVALARMEELSRTDPLTGAQNRRGLDDTLRIEMARARRDGSHLAVGMLDLDFFKRYNSRRGHAGGDALLRDAARAWGTQLRPTDHLARYGGEEFTLVLPQCTVAHATSLVERLRPVMPDLQTFSAGIALWDGQESATQLLQRADQALMEAKRLGRNRTMIADNEAQIALGLSTSA